MRFLRLPFINRLFKKRRKVISPAKVFVPTLSDKQIVIPFKPISAILIAILIVCCSYLILRSDVFLIQEIQIYWQSEPQEAWISKRDIQDATLGLRGRSLLAIDINEIKENLLDQFLPLGNVEIEKKLFNTLIIKVEERKGAALVRAKNGDFLVDEQGLVFLEGEEGLAPMFLDQGREVRLGDQIGSEKVEQAIELIQEFSDLNLFQATSFNVENYPRIDVATQEGTDLLFSGEKNIKEQVMTLQLVVKNAKIEGKSLKKVDLRFDRPVVAY